MRHGAFRYDSPVGRLFVVSSDRGVCRIALGEGEREAARALEALAREPGAASGRRWSPSRIRRALDGYFAGRRRELDLPVDLSSVPAFSRRVLRTLRRAVPFGRTISYGELARLVGRPRAVRAVGRALGANPVPIVIPCHRVLASDGSLGGFGGGLGLKRRLLRIEGITGLRGGWRTARGS